MLCGCRLIFSLFFCVGLVTQDYSIYEIYIGGTMMIGNSCPEIRKKIIALRLHMHTHTPMDACIPN
jgi:hypothetical protein